jgi:hypothetical protein
MTRLSLLAALAFLLPSAARGQFGSQEYRPTSRGEREVANRAQRDVYPQDVRDSLARYAAVVVVWPGIIRQIDSVVGMDSVRLVLEHHFFDWREDHGCQRELYFLSPRGEGLFAMTWANFARDRSARNPVVGSLVIAYGTPVAVDTTAGQSTVSLSPLAVNVIDRGLYRTDAFSYGRGFSDFQLLKVPECSR